MGPSPPPPDKADDELAHKSPILSWDLFLSPDGGATLVPLPNSPGEDDAGQAPLVPSLTSPSATDSTDTSLPSATATADATSGATSSVVSVTSSTLATSPISSLSTNTTSSMESTSSITTLSASSISTNASLVLPSSTPTTSMDSVSNPPLSQASLITLVSLGSLAGLIAVTWVLTLWCRARRRGVYEDELAREEDNFYPFGPEFGVYRARSPRTLSSGQDSEATGFSISRPSNLTMPATGPFDVRPVLGERLTDGPYPVEPRLPPRVGFGSPEADTLGNLKVTNLASCDVSLSSDSRPTSRVGPSSEQSTPRQADMPTPGQAGIGAAMRMKASPLNEEARTPWLNDPITSPSIYPNGDSPADKDHTADGWGNSLRATVANALSSLHSANPFVRPSQVQMQESFTAGPQRKTSISSFGSVRLARALDRAQSIRDLDSGWITQRAETSRAAMKRAQQEDPFADQPLRMPVPAFLKTPVITSYAKRPSAHPGRSSVSRYSQSSYESSQLR